MRLTLTVRGVNVVDLELRWPFGEQQADDAPKLEAGGALAGSELAEQAEPDTVVFGFAPRRES